VIVCSAVDANTIEETIKWKTTINENAETGGDANIPCLLVMNKSDLINP
jgi:GTPase SAR1 family protein